MGECRKWGGNFKCGSPAKETCRLFKQGNERQLETSQRLISHVCACVYSSRKGKI